MSNNRNDASSTQQKGTRLQRIALAVALACAGGTAHVQYSNIYFFGDSLTDSGAFTSLVTAFGAPTANKIRERVESRSFSSDSKGRRT